MHPSSLLSKSSSLNIKSNDLAKRGLLAPHPMAQKLFRIMEEKQTNLALACDVQSQEELVRLADEIGPEICVFKTHIDILNDFTLTCTKTLQHIAEKHRFLIFEDRKFADIGQTVSLQYEKGIYHIAEWADLINAHIVPGPGIIEGLAKVGKPRGRGLLLLAEMSSKNSLAKGSYAQKALALGETHADFVCGFISLRKLSFHPGMIHFTPGVKLQKGTDSLGQKYRTVEEILIDNQSDIIIVGRDITQAPNPKEAAAFYRKRGWECFTH